MSSQAMQRAQLQFLSYMAPSAAGKMATRLFSRSRNEANEYRPALTPMGARVINVASSSHRVEQLYLWGDSGDIVLLIHGWGSNCSSMFAFVQPLLSMGYRVATFDAPAHGSTQGDYATMSEYVAAARQMIETLGDVRYVVAHSLGGIVAMASAAESDIERIVLISSPCSLMDVLDIWSGSFMKLRPVIREKILQQLLHDNGVPVSHWDIGLHGRGWNKPVRLIHDRQDNVVNCRHAEKINQLFSDSEVFYTDGLGHAKILMNTGVHNIITGFFSPETEHGRHYGQDDLGNIKEA